MLFMSEITRETMHWVSCRNAWNGMHGMECCIHGERSYVIAAVRALGAYLTSTDTLLVLHCQGLGAALMHSSE